LNRLLMKAIDYPIIGKYLEGKINPHECYRLWEYHCKGFGQPCRDLLPDDVTRKTKKSIQSVMSKMITNKRDRLLIKITGWSRIGFLSKIFEDAKFIHIMRDGRAVTNSMINVDFWWGWRGPGNWRWGELTESQKGEWGKYNRSFIILAAIEWKILMDALEKAKNYINPNNFLEVKYEDICNSPITIFKEVLEFCHLEWYVDFERAVKEFDLKNTNEKWQKELTVEQKSNLEEFLQDYLKRYNYV
ncbi:MAG: sulfotransferase, partial [Candidatus Scalinduaceae bacterium]